MSARPTAELMHAADEAAPAGWCVLDQECRRAAPLAPGREALDQPAQDQQDRPAMPIEA